MQMAIYIGGLLVYGSLLILVHRQRAWKRLSWFASYLIWECFATFVQLLLGVFSVWLLYKLYWWMEAVEIFLTVAAVRESFLRIFRGFTTKASFRWTVWGLIAAVVIYSAWKAVYAPPLQVDRVYSFVFAAEFAFRWGIFGIAALTAVVSFFMGEPMDTREGAVVSGFGVAAVTWLLYIVSFSFFGKQYLAFMKYVPPVGYFAAAFWWLWIFSRPVKQFGFRELGMGPEDIAKALRRYREFGEQLDRDTLNPNE